VTYLACRVVTGMAHVQNERSPLKRTAFIIGVSLGVLTAGGALAQTGFDRNRNTSVTDRPRPQFAPDGLRAGAFTLYPKVIYDLAHDDNVFAVSSNPKSDFFWRLAPKVQANSNWSRHELKGSAEVAKSSYFNQGNQDNTTWALDGAGRLDIGRTSNVGLILREARSIVPRTSPGSPVNARDPVRFDTTSAQLRGTLGGSRSRLIMAAGRENQRYKDVSTLTGTRLGQSFRDRDMTVVSARAEYAVSPALSVYARYEHNDRDYVRTPTGGVVRSSEGSRSLIGASFEVQALTRGEIEFGRYRQNYKSALIGDIDGFAAQGKLEWFPTPLATVTLSGQTSVEDAAIVNAQGFKNREIELSADYEMLRNLILTGRFGFAGHDYQGLDRKDEFKTATLASRYLVNRNFTLGADLSRIERSSSGVSAERSFTENVMRVTVSYAR